MTSAAKMARALAARELAQCPIDWSMIERDRQMTSDVKPATDYEISGIKAAMPDHFYQKHRMLADMGLLLARISADAARIRELEARQVPDGWQVVPKEPTRAMHDASDEILSGPSWTGVVPPDCRFDDYVRKLEWAAMLAAAPRP